MGRLFKCACGTAYNLEENKKYKCKKCGAIMALPAEAAAAAPAAAKTATSAQGSNRPAPRTAPSAPGRPAAGSTRPSLRSRTEGSAPPPPKGLSTGLKIGIGVFIGISLILVLMLSGGSEVDKGKISEAKSVNDAVTKEQEAEQLRINKEKAAIKVPPKKLTKAEVDSMLATIRQGESAKDTKVLYGLLQQIKDENWEVDRTPLYRALLRLNPNDPQVTSSMGAFERDKLNFDEMSERYKRAEKAKDVKALKDVVQWVFEGKLDDRIDYLLVYKAILRVDPNDHDARVARGLDPYDGNIQEYKGKKLHADEFQDVKKLEWKLSHDGK